MSLSSLGRCSHNELLYEVIIRPIVSSSLITEQGKYTFEVSRNAGREDCCSCREALLCTRHCWPDFLCFQAKEQVCIVVSAGRQDSPVEEVVTPLLVRLIEIFGNNSAGRFSPVPSVRMPRIVIRAVP